MQRNFGNLISFSKFAAPIIHHNRKIEFKNIQKMFAIVDIAGQQFKVKKDQKVFVHRLAENEGSSVEFSNVLLIDNEGSVTVGSPSIDGARVAAKVLTHAKGDKVIVFKKKRRKGYQKSNGHRQYFTQILIQGILGKDEILKIEEEVKKPAKAKKAVTEAETEEVAAPKKASSKKTADPKAEKAPVKRAPKKKGE